jgi:hypothetical protein
MSPLQFVTLWLSAPWFWLAFLRAAVRDAVWHHALFH